MPATPVPAVGAVLVLMSSLLAGGLSPAAAQTSPGFVCSSSGYLAVNGGSSSTSASQSAACAALMAYLGSAANSLNCDGFGTNDYVYGTTSGDCTAAVAALHTRLGTTGFSCYNDNDGAVVIRADSAACAAVPMLNSHMTCDWTTEYLAEGGCQQLTVCIPGSTHQTIPPTQVSDRICANGTACTAGGTFAHANATPLANTDCAACRDCSDLAGQVALSSCTPFRNTVCGPPPTNSPTTLPPTNRGVVHRNPSTGDPSSSSSSSPSPLTTFDKVAIGCVAVVVVVLIAYLVQCYFGLAKTTDELRQQGSLQERLLDEAHGEMARRDQVWQIPVDHVRFLVQLAAGTFGEVWKGAYGGQAVAIKLLRRPIDDEADPEAAEEFQRETATLQKIRHPHLLIFFGSGITAENKPFLVTEFMELGSLRVVLADAGRALAWAVRARIAAEIAAGMAHLHSLDIVHRDLKSDNCLCDADLNTKIADFGTAKLVQGSKGRGAAADDADDADAGDETTAETAFSAPGVGQPGTATMTKGTGTPLWMAPEVFAGGSRYGPEVDVYSYGVIMWELLTRQQPWDELEATQYIEFQAKLSAALEAGRRPAVDPADAEAHPQYVAMMAKCWAGDPFARPTFEMVSFGLAL